MRVMHCPTHTGENVQFNLNSVNTLRPTVVGFTEMYRPESVRLAQISLTGYQVCSQDRGGHSQENLVAVKVKSPLRPFGASVQTHRTVRLSTNIPGPGTGNDRWMNVVRFTHRGTNYAHIATHWNASIQNRNTGLVNIHTNDRAFAMVHAFHVMDRTIAALKVEQREIFVTGDFNYRKYDTPEFRLWEYSPQKLFQKNGLEFFEQGLDYLAWSTGVRLRSDIRVIPTTDPLNGSDHPWLVGEFKRV